MGSSSDLHVVCSKKPSEVVLCPWLRSGKQLCSQITRDSEPLRKKISRKGPNDYHSSRKNSIFLRKKFRTDYRRFLEDFLCTLRSTVATRSLVEQGLKCFCPEMVIRGDDYSVFHFFGHFLKSLMELRWVRWSEIEAAKAEIHSFVREQRQVEESASRSPAPINSVLGLCNQPGFRDRRNL